ncbi:hypothetical protein ES708_14877 [subsurface metagenome]
MIVKKILKMLLMGISIVILIGSECPEPEPPETYDPDLPLEHIDELRDEYSTYSLTVPPRSAFSAGTRAYSANYQFWTADHLTCPTCPGICTYCRGTGLNTSDPYWAIIAILDWEVELGVKADQVNDELTSEWSGNVPIWITSAYRNPARNMRIPGHSPTSNHMFGHAIDFDGESPAENDMIRDAVSEAGGNPVPEGGGYGWIHANF